jgi:hypothetical protein
MASGWFATSVVRRAVRRPKGSGGFSAGAQLFLLPFFAADARFAFYSSS